MYLDFRLHGGSQDASTFPRYILIFDYMIIKYTRIQYLYNVHPILYTIH